MTSYYNYCNFKIEQTQIKKAHIEKQLDKETLTGVLVIKKLLLKHQFIQLRVILLRPCTQ